MSALQAIPLLRADNASMDWREARYEAKIEISGQVATVANKLSRAQPLDDLIATGAAQWALELRCPKTLYAHVYYSDSKTFSCEWNSDEVDGEIFLTPGLVSVAPCLLPTDGLNALWGDESIDLEAGRWLARGAVLRTESLASSLLKFRPDSSLADGVMTVEHNTANGDLHFVVSVSQKHYDQVVRTSRDVQIAALIAAFGQIPHLDQGDEQYAILSQIKAVLSEANVPIWGGGGGGGG